MINKVLVSSLRRIDGREEITPGALVEHVRIRKTIGVVVDQRASKFSNEDHCTVCWAVAPSWWEDEVIRSRSRN